MNELSLFSGYGGLSLALKLTGIQTRTVAYVEWEKYPQGIIKARIKDGYLDDAPLFGDISTFRGEQFRGVVDIITAGFPCPPFSQAGLHRGVEDPRNKWPDTLRVIREVRPQYVLLENVPGILTASRKRGTPSYGAVVVGELAETGYDCFWQVIGADDVGAPHRRKRWLCFGVLADCKGERLEGVRVNSHQEGWQESDGSVGLRSRTIPTWPPGPSQSDEWGRVLTDRPDLAPALTKKAESQFRGMVDGRSHRVDELKALGNGVVPAVVALFLRRLQ